MSSKFVRGKYISGCGHSVHRPKFYEEMKLHRGTINILVEPGTQQSILVPTMKVPGYDPIDMHQEFLIRPCVLKRASGYQILPIDKSTGMVAGHHAGGIIEIALCKRIDLRPEEELEVELQGYED